MATLAVALAGWAGLAGLALDMDSDWAQWTMPPDAAWQPGHWLGVLAMWAVMMAAMMLPSALPMCASSPGWARGAAHRVMCTPSSPATSAHGAPSAPPLRWRSGQAAGWTDPMIVRTSAPLSAALLAIAGLYQFTPLKRLCLAGCRTPLGFLLGEWRAGGRGAWIVGWRHGLLCVGCCWALMALLFVGGAMNLAWVAALAVAVAIEKLAPGGEQIARALGEVLIGAGSWRWLGA